jgi:adenine-specific DNA-methyltransferase
VRNGDGIFILKPDEVKNLNLGKNEQDIIKPFYTTEQISRYFTDKKNKKWIIYSDNRVVKNIDKYPKIKMHLKKYESVITSDFKPFGLHRARNENFFKEPSIFSIRKTEKPQFSYVDFPCYVSQTYFIISTKRTNLKFLTGILNSQLVYFWLKNKGKLQGDLLQIDKVPILDIPIYIGSKSEQNQIIALVDKITKLNKEIRAISENSEKWHSIKSEIERTDKKIDDEVYKLYGLNQEDIEKIENLIK